MADFINNPHDKLFKEVFSNEEEASVFLKESLPSNVSNKINWKTLKVEKSSFIDPELKGSESDLLYNVKLDKSAKKPIFTYCLNISQLLINEWLYDC